MTNILYLAHDLDDAAIWRRVSMLEAGGAKVAVVGFRRLTTPLERPALVLGQTHNGKIVHRALSSLRVLTRAREIAREFAPDIIMARNLEMLPLATRIKKRCPQRNAPRIYYEVLDVHRLMIGQGIVAMSLRWLERRLCKQVENVIVSSNRFDEEHFSRYRQIASPPILIENKVWDGDKDDRFTPFRRDDVKRIGPLVVGWFGILRCAASLECLDQVTRRLDGRVQLVLRGKPALDAIPDFHRIVDANPHITFCGPYDYHRDLARIYSATDLAWLVDRYDANANSDWLLPNRLYESCAHGAIPLALDGTETSRFLRRRGIGVVVRDLRPVAVASVLLGLDKSDIAALARKQDAIDPSTWRTTQQDCVALVRLLAEGTRKRPASVVTPRIAAGDLAR